VIDDKDVPLEPGPYWKVTFERPGSSTTQVYHLAPDGTFLSMTSFGGTWKPIREKGDDLKLSGETIEIVP